MRTFYARVDFTDERGLHKAGQPVTLPYSNEVEIAAAMSLEAYGVVSTRAPEGKAENRPAPAPPAAPAGPVVEAGPVVYATEEERRQKSTPHPDKPETPFWDARREDGSFAPKEEKVTTHDHSVGEDEEPKAEEPKKGTRRKR